MSLRLSQISKGLCESSWEFFCVSKVTHGNDHGNFLAEILQVCANLSLHCFLHCQGSIASFLGNQVKNGNSFWESSEKCSFSEHFPLQESSCTKSIFLELSQMEPLSLQEICRVTQRKSDGENIMMLPYNSYLLIKQNQLSLPVPCVRFINFQTDLCKCN